jgi:paraquat-inducible protein B
MKTRANPRLIGAFVLGAAALIVAALVVLGSGRFLGRRERYVAFFPRSVRGLKAGAPVTFRGVQIGEIVDVDPRFTGQGVDVEIAVIFDIYVGRVRDPGFIGHRRTATPTEWAHSFIEKGLRAELLSQSLLTGQQYVNLDFHPDRAGRLVGLEKRYPEVPTVPTAIEQLQDKLEEAVAKLAGIPFDELAGDLRRLAQTLEQTAKASDLPGTSEALRRSAARLDQSLSKADETLREVTALAQEAKAEITPTAAEARTTLAKAREALAEFKTAAASTSDLTVDVSRTLAEVSRAAASITTLTDYLGQHPEALVIGKEKEKQK